MALMTCATRASHCGGWCSKGMPSVPLRTISSNLLMKTFVEVAWMNTYIHPCVGCVMYKHISSFQVGMFPSMLQYIIIRTHNITGHCIINATPVLRQLAPQLFFCNVVPHSHTLHIPSHSPYICSVYNIYIYMTERKEEGNVRIQQRIRVLKHIRQERQDSLKVTSKTHTLSSTAKQERDGTLFFIYRLV
jgi:hypothetical protein